ISDESGAQNGNLIKLRFGMIMEFDEDGNLIWSWKTSKYYQESDLAKNRKPGGTPIFDLHENSFYFNEKEKVIYLSCKRISRILKIKYPEGTVIGSYGDVYETGMPEIGNEFF